MLEGWRHADLRECVEEIRSGKSVNSLDEPAKSDGIGVLKTSCVYSGKFDPRENKAVLPSERTLVKCPVTAGTIIVSRMNTAELVGASGYVDQDHPNIFLPDRLWAVFPKQGIDPIWLYYITSSPETRAHLSDIASGTSASMKNISQDVFLSIPARIPPLPEQRKIAEILRTWDEAIEKLYALRSVKEGLYSTLADGLIFGTIGNDGCAWELRRLGEVTRELTQRNHDGKFGRELVMGVTNSRGIVPMRQQTIGSNLARYKILPPKAFAYNPMRINVGSIAMLRLPSEVLVSPDYVLFECIPGKLDPDYLDHLRQSHFWGHYINAGGSGSVRMRTYYDDLAALRLKLPEFEEQQKISAILNTAQAEIDLLVSEIETLTRQKRGLMQKLLTGEWPVQVEQAA